MNISDLSPGEVFVSAPERVHKLYRSDGSQLPYAVTRRHFMGLCVHGDGSCAEGLGRGPAMLEAYAEWPWRGSFSSDEEHEKVCQGYKRLGEHAAGFFKEFDIHNEE